MKCKEINKNKNNSEKIPSYEKLFESNVENLKEIAKFFMENLKIRDKLIKMKPKWKINQTSIHWVGQVTGEICVCSIVLYIDLEINYYYYYTSAAMTPVDMSKIIFNPLITILCIADTGTMAPICVKIGPIKIKN